jgi:Zn-dependent metalloprotease
MYRITRLSTTTLAVLLLLAAPGAAQFRQSTTETLTQPIDSATVDVMAQAGDLVIVSRYADSLLSDRTHEYLAQYVDGVPVHGAGVSRQTWNGETVSLFGRIHEGIDVETVPFLSSDAALAGLARATGALSVDTPALVILPLPDAGYRLTYRALMSDARLYFVDAADGSIVWSHDVAREQRAVGVGTGIAGDRKNVSTTRAEGLYQTIDRLRPAEIVTLDMKLDENRLLSLISPGPPDVPRWSAGDLAADTNNVWNDNPAAVDGHVHTGWTYDYFAQRHDWHGVDGQDGRIVSLVNNDYFNAFYIPPPFGPAGRGASSTARSRTGRRSRWRTSSPTSSCTASPMPW